MARSQTRSPVPPSAPGPGPSARVPSPNLPHRPSTSSNRSLRRTEADFEAALLDTGSTIFLSAGPSGISEEAELTNMGGSSGQGKGKEKGKGLGIGLGLGPVAIAPTSKNHFDDGDRDAPIPIEKRSFEDDMRELAISPSQSQSQSQRDARAELGISPIRGMQTGVIPPTPSTSGHTRRGSQMTTGSVTSTGTNDTPSRRRQSKSLGIDAELGEKPINKHTMPKRRSIFRSAGTASSPDLASLVRKAKEAKPVPGIEDLPQSPPTAGPTTTTNPMSASSSAPRANGRPTSSSSRHPAPASSPSPAPGASSPRQLSRERSITSPKTAEEHWERYGAMLGGNQMASIAEGSGTVGGVGRQRQHTDEGFKSMRNKAKGVFGKMFGTSTSRNEHTSTTPSSATSSRFPDMTSDQPPVPPVPSAYAMARRKAPDPPSDVFGEDVSRQRPVTSSSMPPPRQPSPVYGGRTSVTPTGDRWVSSGSNHSNNKPLPEIRDGDTDLRRTPSANQRVSGHVRQPASATYEDSPPRREPPLPLAPSPATQAVSMFTADVTGMLAGIGQSEPARELGLPPDSLRRDQQRDRTASIETAREIRTRPQAELGRSASVQESSQHLLSPGSITIPTPASAPVLAGQRTSSLPLTSNKNGTKRPMPSRIAPSPNTSNGGGSGELTLMPVAQAVSRSSSRSSTKKSDGRNTVPSSPSVVERKKSYDGHSPLLPSSVRLVSTPRPDSVQSVASPLNLTSEGAGKSSFINTSPWGKQAAGTLSDSAGRMDDQLEVVNSPPETPTTPTTQHEEDEEEKGRRLACEFLENDTSTVARDRVAEFLGGPRRVNAIALKYYMQYFDMKAQGLVESFRDLCHKLHLKAESQEIDRILDAFSSRYFECNPSTVFGTPGVVHTVTAAMLMLNTDLHIAELNKHMSRTDFIRNAMRAIHESMPAVDRSSTPDLVRDDGSSSKLAFGSNASMAPSFVSVRAKTPVNSPSTQRSASAPVVTHPHPPSRADSVSSIGTAGMEGKTRSSSTTISCFNYGKAWEVEAETALREIYSSVKADRILLPISDPANRQSILSVSSNGPYDRARTVRSPSDRVNALKRGSIRGMQGLLNNPYGSNWSASDGRLSPTPSYATSINEGLGSFAPTLGFASNLSHTVIREHDDEVRSIDSQITDSDAEDMDDDELALLGAPWAKEGILSRKLYWESVGKRAKKNDWKQFFVVISKGDLYMFTFGEKGSGSFGGGSVGGGNWLENANANGTISLMHAMAVALPKPGYSPNRPYCFSLASPSGETSFFQAGTEDLVAEWVATCNYWAARKSRQPLQGGVSNMEYGWNRALEPQPADDQDDRASVMSGRSNLTKLGGTYGRRNTVSGGGMNDRIYINEWKPPPPATMPSPLDEEGQLEALQAYLRSLVDELEQHKRVEEAMTRLYSLGSKNLHKARDNWKAKSHYIHTEIFKYETYVESLRNAISLRVKKQGEKKLEKSLARSMTSLHHTEEEEGEVDMSTIRR